MRVNLRKVCGLIFYLLLNGRVIARETVNHEDDSLKVIALNEQALKYSSLNADSGIYFGELALKLSLHAKQYEHLNETHRILGWCYYQQQNFKKAQLHLQSVLNDSSLKVQDRNKTYEALSIAAEKNGDFQHAYWYLNTTSHFKDSLNQQKQSSTLSELQSQLDANAQLKKEATEQYQKLVKTADEKDTQLKEIFIASEVLLLLVIGLLCFLLYYNNKKFKKAVAEKNIELSHFKKQVDDYQSEFAGLHHLKNEVEAEHRERRKEEIIVEEKPPVIVEPQPQKISLLDYYPNASEEERKIIIPRLKLFHQNIPIQLQQIEQAFSKHDWNKINDTLQSIKPFVQSLGMQKEESLINQINEHVNTNATNRAVVKLLQVKSSCLKTIGVIESILK